MRAEAHLKPDPCAVSRPTANTSAESPVGHDTTPWSDAEARRVG